MSFDPVTGGPCYLADIRRGACRQIADVRFNHTKWEKPVEQKAEATAIEIAQQMEQWARDFSTDEDHDVFLGWAQAVRRLSAERDGLLQRAKAADEKIDRLTEAREWAVARAEAAEAKVAELHEAAPNCLFYKEQAEYWRGIAQQERERCAKIAESAGCGDPKCMSCYGNQIAASIRDVGQQKVSGADQ